MESAKKVRDLHRRRLDAMHTAVYPQAVEGSLDAQAGVLRIMDRQAKLEGIDAPSPRGAGAGSAAGGVFNGTVKIVIIGGLPQEPRDDELPAALPAPEPSAE